jgi:hypothetical protein
MLFARLAAWFRRIVGSMSGLALATLLCNALLLIFFVASSFVRYEAQLWILWLFYLLVIVAPILSIVTILHGRRSN